MFLFVATHCRQVFCLCVFPGAFLHHCFGPLPEHRFRFPGSFGGQRHASQSKFVILDMSNEHLGLGDVFIALILAVNPQTMQNVCKVPLLFIRLFVCLFVCQFVYLFVCFFVCKVPLFAPKNGLQPLRPLNV